MFLWGKKLKICGPLTCFLLMSPAGVGWVWSLCKAHVRPACSGHPEHWLHSPGRAGQKDRRQRETGCHREATICYQSICRVTVNTFSTTFFLVAIWVATSQKQHVCVEQRGIPGHSNCADFVQLEILHNSFIFEFKYICKVCHQMAVYH